MYVITNNRGGEARLTEEAYKNNINPQRNHI
jgi:hypothetical protein